MENYPGEKSNIPKRIIDSLKEQPLTYLVPKDGLVSLIDSPLHLVLNHGEPNFENSSQLIDVVFEEASDPILYRKPANYELLLNGRNPDLDMTKTLSDTAKKFLSGLEVNMANIVRGGYHNEKPLKRRQSSSDSSFEDSALDLTNTSQIKRANTGTGVSMNLATVAEQHVESLIKLMDDVVNGSQKNVEHWKILEDGSSVLLPSCLSQLQLVIQNIVTLPQSWKIIPTSILQQVLEIMANNIDNLAKLKSSSNIATLNISLLSTKIIFMIYLIDNDTKELVIDRYVSAPIDFVTELIIELKNREGTFPEDVLSMLLEAISPLPQFLSLKSFIDEEIITKFVYLFVDIIFLNQTDSIMASKITKLLTNIKIIGSQVLCTLFNKFPTQQDFIVNELLSLADNIPQKRNARKLYPIESDVYVTSFTFMILQLLSNLNIYDHCHAIKSWSEESVETALNLHGNDMNTIKKYSEMIAENLIIKLNDNTMKYRHILENYIQDLAQLLPNHHWPLVETILDSITKRLLMIFKSNQTNNINIEISALQNLGTIYCTVFMIKQQLTADNNETTYHEIATNSTLIQRFSSFFDHCIAVNREMTAESNSAKVSWELKLDFLVNIKAAMNLDQKEQKDPTSMDHEILNHLQRNIDDFIKLDANDSNGTEFISIMSLGNLYRLYDSYLKTVLALLSSEKAKLRSTAIKNLSTLALHDQTILSNFLVKQTIQRRLSDSSSSVKDAILDLISIGTSYLDYFEEINANFNDDNVTIRKHVLKLNEKIYDDSTEDQVRVFVASRILLRTEDEEDNIVQLAREILLNRWIILPSSTIGDTITSTEKFKSVLHVMVNIFAMGEKFNELLDSFLNYYLLKPENHNSNSYRLILTTLTNMVNILVDEIIFKYGSDTNPSLSPNDQLLRYLNLLAIFSDSIIPFITKDHLFSLYPYLFAGHNGDVQLCILYVFKNSMKKLKNFKLGFLEDLEKSILTNLTKITTLEVETCIPLVWEISNQTNDYTKITKAASSSLNQLSRYIDIANTDPKSIQADGKLQRLMHISSNIARYCNLEDKGEKIKFLLEKETYCEYVAKCLIILSKPAIASTVRRVAVKCLIKICSNNTKLFNSKFILEILDFELGGKDKEIKLIIIQSLYEFFMDEERKSSRDLSSSTQLLSSKVQNKNIDKTKSEKRPGSDTICFSLVSRYLKYFLQNCLKFSNKKLSEVSTKLVHSIVKFNFVNPSQCLPTVMSLLISPNEKQRLIAKSSLAIIYDNFQSLLFGSLSKGIENTIIYAESAYQDKFTSVETFLVDLQSMVLQDKKANQKFINLLMKILQRYTSILVSKGCTETELNQIAFYSINISNLVFTNQQELVTVLKILDSISEDFKEFIIQNIRQIQEANEHNPKREKYLRNLITIQVITQELTLYLLRKHDLDTDVLFYDSNDNELKQIMVFKNQEFQEHFHSKYDETKKFWTSKSLSSYLNLVDNSID